MARDGVPFRKGLAFDYLLAGDGVYLVADNADLAVRVPIADCEVRGLPPVYPSCNLKHGRFPRMDLGRHRLGGTRRLHERP